MALSERRREILGTGPFATVYAQWDALLGRTVAVKEAHREGARNPDALRLFVARAQSLIDLEHPNLMAVHRVIEGGEVPVVVREWAEETLAAVVAAAPLPPPEVAEVLAQILLGLQALHDHGLVHGAIKPQNLFRSGRRYRLGDYGLGATLGLPAGARRLYLAPEILRGEPGEAAADLYALGRVAYELALGTPRFSELASDPWPLLPLDELLPDCPPELSATLQNLTRQAAAYRSASPEAALELMGRSPSEETAAGLDVPLGELAARLRPDPGDLDLVDRRLQQTLTRALGVVVAILLLWAGLFLSCQRPNEPRSRPAAPASGAR